MANKDNHRHFGHVRKLPSNRYQASYLGPDGTRRYAPETFVTKTDANAWLSTVEADLLRGEWVDPLLGKVKLEEFGTRWIKERSLGVRTREEYNRIFRLHVVPLLDGKTLNDISTETVRSWRQHLLDNGRSATTTAKAYRLLRAILNTALDDNRIKRNPCRIKGADQEKAPERPVASVPQVFTLAESMPPRFRLLVLAAAFTGLRWGELIGLRRGDVDLDAPTVKVPRRLAQLNSGKLVAGPPKSEAGYRTVALPDILVDDFRRHLMAFVGAGPEALMFVGPKGAGLKRGNWHRSVKWIKTVKVVGLPEGFHFHDLRHTGNTLAAASGASTRELMHRMGHGSMRAALIYQHATSERDREIAAKLSRRVKAARKRRT
ncbi:tyrosine-type recombinase/integrase [Actinosynnema sp. NPDC050436]|uniref:tyrosine-type recombinase/integrase n=1 Tax=Actinosynnema sp. NPDC050436 TaxID=3155659 RepID=UPI0034104569